MRSVPPAFWAAAGKTLPNSTAPASAWMPAPTPRLSNAIVRNPYLDLVLGIVAPSAHPGGLRQPRRGGQVRASTLNGAAEARDREGHAWRFDPHVPGQSLRLAPGRTADLRRRFGLFFFGFALLAVRSLFLISHSGSPPR